MSGGLGCLSWNVIVLFGCLTFVFIIHHGNSLLYNQCGFLADFQDNGDYGSEDFSASGDEVPYEA